MKKYLSLLLALILAVSLAACGGRGVNDAANNGDDIGTPDNSAAADSTEAAANTNAENDTDKTVSIEGNSSCNRNQ